MEDLIADHTVQGIVRNLTSFGAFVDIGVGVDGLLHSSRFHSSKPLSAGAVIDVRILEIDRKRRRISLSLASMPDALNPELSRKKMRREKRSRPSGGSGFSRKGGRKRRRK